MKEFWDEFGGLFIALLIFLIIATLTVALGVTLASDKIIYEFDDGDEVVVFEVTSLNEHTETYYRFTLTDGSTITYYPKPGTTVRMTKVRY